MVKRFGDVVAVNNIALHIRDGEFFSLLGPSGCGKTTTLRLIAGFETPTSGVIAIGGQDQSNQPPYKRPVNTVFQNYALFPHMTVAENVAFGLAMTGATRTEIRHRVGEALDMVHLSGLEERRPKQLSGGQQQRVALARALVNRPKVLLLDEPLGALDMKLRKAMQVELKALQHQVGITFIYVTHDQEEALTMSDRIAVMNGGNVLQVDTPEHIYERPTSQFVADFIGETNFIHGVVVSAAPTPTVRIADDVHVSVAWMEAGLSKDMPAVLSIRPEKLQLRKPNGATPDCAHIARVYGHIEQVVYVGADTRYTVRMGDGRAMVGRMQNGHADGQRFGIGDWVEVRWDTAHARVLRQ